MKLYVDDNGDPSVGIFSQTWVIECPFEYDENDTQNMEQFRIDIIRIYSEYAEGKITADYDFECYKDEDDNPDYYQCMCCGNIQQSSQDCNHCCGPVIGKFI